MRPGDRRVDTHIVTLRYAQRVTTSALKIFYWSGVKIYIPFVCALSRQFVASEQVGLRFGGQGSERFALSQRERASASETSAGEGNRVRTMLPSPARCARCPLPEGEGKLETQGRASAVYPPLIGRTTYCLP